MTATESTAEPSVRDLTITLTSDAPRVLMYRGRAEPRLLERWMGPCGVPMEVPAWEIDTGGPWRFVNLRPSTSTWSR